jgi:hypothetical protein
LESSSDDIEDVVKDIIPTEVECTESEEEFVKAAEVVKSQIYPNETEQNGALGKIPYLFFSVAFSAWIVSLLAVYLPIIRWATPTFPLIVGDNLIAIFLASTAIASITSLLIGLNKLGRK